MSGALRVLRAELVRLLTSPAALVAGFLAFIVPMLRVYVSGFGEKVAKLTTGSSGGSAPAVSQGDGWAMLVDGWRTGMILSTALLLVQAAHSVAGDRESGVLRLAVTRSASRSGAIVGRALLGPLMAIVLVVISGAGAWLAANFLGGDFGDLVEDNYTILEHHEIRAELMRALAAALLGLFSIHAYGMLTSSVIRGPLAALAVSLASIVVWDLMKDNLGSARWFVFASHAPTFFDGSSMKEMTGFARGMSDAGLRPEVLRTAWIFPGSEAILMIALSCLAVRKQPI